MPMPNITDSTFGSLLFRCKCGGHDLELFFDDKDNEYWMNVTVNGASLWQALKWWWKYRQLWTTDVELTKEDMVALRDALIKHTEYEKSDKETLKEEAQGSQAS